MPKHPSIELRADHVIEIAFPRFTARMTFHAAQQLTIAVIKGDNAGFTDTIEYEAVIVCDEVVALSWQEHIGSTIVSILDLANSETLTFVTPAGGGFLRLSGRIASGSLALSALQAR
jgi:hypothetical protein